MGSISNLNALPLYLQSMFPTIPHEIDNSFLYTPEHLQKVWFVLIVFSVVPLVIAYILLRNVKKDTRG